MESYWKVVAKVEWEDEKGKTKYRKEDYLVSAISPTDAETKVGEELKGSDFEIVGVNLTKFISVIK